MKALAALATLLLLQDMPDNREAMKPMEWFVGTWTGSGEMPEVGKYEEELKYEWTLNKNFVKTEHAMKSGGKTLYSATGMIGYDSEKKKFVGFGFGIDGTIGWMEQAKSDAADTFVFEGRNSGPSETAKMRVTIKKATADSMVWKCEKETDGKWAAMRPETTYTRQKEKKDK